MEYLEKARGGLEAGGAREGEEEEETEGEGRVNAEKDCTPSTDKQVVVKQSELLPSEGG